LIDGRRQELEGTVVPETFTHGTSAQRVAWFKRGVGSGDPAQCDTFNADPL
jgi:predicted metalloprotease